jgi:hypothetical protein
MAVRDIPTTDIINANAATSEFSTTLLYDPNKPATRLLGGDKYDDEGNCYKSGVLGKVPCNKFLAIKTQPLILPVFIP